MTVLVMALMWIKRSLSVEIIFLLCLCYGALSIDLCERLDTDIDDAPSFKKGFIPYGGTEAGKYSRDYKAKTRSECFWSCCLDETCNVLFFEEGKCFLIACNESYFGGCDPVRNKAKKFDDAYFLTVRSVEYVQYTSVDSSSAEDLLAADDCRLNPADASCSRDYEECVSVIVSGVTMYKCVCIRGYSWNTTVKHCIRTGVHSRTSCEVGLLDQCPQGEQCVAKVERSRSGYCECIQGFERNPATAACVGKVVNSPLQTNHSSNVTELKTTPSAASTTIKPTAVSTAAGVTAASAAVVTAVPTTLVTPDFAAGIVTAAVEALVVSAGNSRAIQLPLDSTTLFAYVLPRSDVAADTTEYKYQWSLFAQPSGVETGEMADINSASVKLSKLRAGMYTFKVAVNTDIQYGEAFVNITVLPPARKNTPPVAIVKPTDQEVNHLNDIIIDGSGSTDDDKIVRYHWEQVTAPMVSVAKIDDSDLERATLILKGIEPGTYRFKLTVTDSDGATDFAFANVTVIKEMDYPPSANAGSNVIISLPQRAVTLYGNASTDDKGVIASYEWTRISDAKLTADMVGVRSPVLQLANLEVGDYRFQLKVTDSAGQSSVADVHVFVKPEHNQPPVADAGKDRTVWLPLDQLTLDGSNSTDDQKIGSYLWSLVSSPNPPPTIENSDRAIATVSKLTVGVYKFKLMLKDNEGLETSTTVTITVNQNENKPPIANAGGSLTVTLPLTVVRINGSKSTDDRGIVSYLWTRDKSSPAAGEVVPNTDHEPVLQLVNIIDGRYIFNLKVTDADGMASSDSMSLIVRPEVHEHQLVEILLATDIRFFSETNKETFINQLSMVLHHGLQSGETSVIIDRLTEDLATGRAFLQFHVETVNRDQHDIWSGPEVVTTLKRKLKSGVDLLDFRIIKFDTVVCQNNCSGHGRCDQITNSCVCEGFWMEDIFKSSFGLQESNCDWSVLYVIIIAFGVVLAISFLLWAIICICRRCSQLKPKVKRHRYALLERLDDEEEQLVAKRKPDVPVASVRSQNSSLMASESDLSSEETIFINTRKPPTSNGSYNKQLPNGIVKPIQRVKVSA